MSDSPVLDLGLAPRAPQRRQVSRADFAAMAAAGLFMIAVIALAVPVVFGAHASSASLVLLIGVAGTSFLGVFAFAAAHQPPARSLQPAVEDLLGALSEPAATVSVEGRISAVNAHFVDIFGGWERLPRDGAEGQSVYRALRQAERGAEGMAEITSGADRHRLIATRIDARRLLVRLNPLTSPEPPVETLDRSIGVAVPSEGSPRAALDAFAGGSPFGAALIGASEAFEGELLEVNPALVALSEGAAKPGVRFSDLFDPGAMADAKSSLAARPEGPVEIRLKVAGRAAGRIVHLYLAHRSEGLQTAYLLDVSDQKQLEMQLAQSQKMQAIGQLAGGVAHDFNNLLTAIQLRLDELLHRHPVGDPSYEGLTEIRQTGVRAADLVRKLLAFSRKQTVQRETLELGELISEFEVVLRRLLREDVGLVTDYGRDLPLVRADKSQLETAVMNLAVNARDALRSHGTFDGGKGEVRIATRRLSQAEAEKLGFPGAPAEGCALIEVSDNGPGMSQEVLSKIFEPFFTTKAVGEGTGLGLATVYGIVKQADGWIHVESEPGRGAAFRVFLPVYVPSAEEAAAPVVVKAKPVARDLSGAGRILFVEDEDVVRGVAARLLRARGYEVIEAGDGEEALMLAEEHSGQIDLLISDVIMPGLDGPTLLKKARAFLQDAPVMFISGYAEAEFSDLLEGEPNVSFLPKPLDIKVLAERVKQLLQPA